MKKTMFNYADIVEAVENATKKECNYCAEFCTLNPDNTEQRIHDKMIALAAIQSVLHEFYRLHPVKD